MFDLLEGGCLRCGSNRQGGQEAVVSLHFVFAAQFSTNFLLSCRQAGSLSMQRVDTREGEYVSCQPGPCPLQIQIMGLRSLLPLVQRFPSRTAATFSDAEEQRHNGG